MTLSIIRQWAHKWKMEINPEPTKQATEDLFSCKPFSPKHPQLLFNGTVVAKVNEQKHLVLIPPHTHTNKQLKCVCGEDTLRAHFTLRAHLSLSLNVKYSETSL